MNEYDYLWAQWGILNHDQFLKVKAYFGNLKTAWHKIGPTFLEHLGFGIKKIERLVHIKRQLDEHHLFKTIEKHKVRLISIDDPDYPPLLKNIYDAPPFLFIRGEIPPLHKAIAIVGTRKVTAYGKMATERITTELIQNNFTIVSGLAIGVDAIAHQSCLDASGSTIGILGSGVDEIYPKTNERLAEEMIKKRGAVISEYPLGTKPARHHFPERNRLIAGMSKGLVVTEGGVKSGALITAKLALEQNREVFAVPNNITKKDLSGTNYLIRKGEAKLIESANDILEEFNMQPIKRPCINIEISTTEKEIINHLTNEEKTIDELIIMTQKNIGELSVTLTKLQLKGLIKETHTKWHIV